MTSFKVGDKVRIKKNKDRYTWFSGDLRDYTIGNNSLGKMRDEGVVLNVESLEFSDFDKMMGVSMVEHNYIMSEDDLELVDSSSQASTLEEYMACLGKDHPARKEYEELMECKFRLEGLDK